MHSFMDTKNRVKTSTINTPNCKKFTWNWHTYIIGALQFANVVCYLRLLLELQLLSFETSVLTSAYTRGNHKVLKFEFTSPAQEFRQKFDKSSQFFSLVNRFLFQVKLAIPLNIPLCIWLFYVVHHAITRRSLAVPFFLCCNCFIVSSNSLIIVFMIAHKSLQLIENKHITSAE